MSMTVNLLKDNAGCQVHLNYHHNHPNKCLQALTFRDIAPSTAQQIKEMFEKGYSPGNIFIFIIFA